MARSREKERAERRAESTREAQLRDLARARSLMASLKASEEWEQWEKVALAMREDAVAQIAAVRDAHETRHDLTADQAHACRSALIALRSRVQCIDDMIGIAQRFESPTDEEATEAT